MLQITINSTQIKLIIPKLFKKKPLSLFRATGALDKTLTELTIRSLRYREQWLV